MADFTTTTSAVFVPEVWSMQTVVATEKKLVAAKLVSRFDADVAGKGDVIHVPQVSNFSQARTKAADTDVTLDAITESEVQITVDKHKYVAFALEDILVKQSAYDLESFYTEKAGYEIAKAVDTDLLSLYTGLTTTDAGSYEANITDAFILSGMNVLLANDVPREDLNMVIHAQQVTALLGIDKFVKADFLGQYDQPTRVADGYQSNYLFGSIYGIPVYFSTNVQVTAGTTSQVHNVLIHKEAWSLAMQQAPRVQKQYLVQKLSDVVVTDIIYGVKTLRGDFGVEIRTKLS
jgi:hypothetical protein